MKRIAFDAVALCLILAGALSIDVLRAQSQRIITPAAADSLIRVDTFIVLLDVRTKEEYDGELGHLKGGILICELIFTNFDSPSPFVSFGPLP